jgi:hypothetical protein
LAQSLKKPTGQQVSWPSLLKNPLDSKFSFIKSTPLNNSPFSQKNSPNLKEKQRKIHRTTIKTAQIIHKESAENSTPFPHFSNIYV